MNPTPTSQDMLQAKVTSRIAQAAHELDGVLGIAIRDLASGEEIMVNADTAFPTGSAIKIPVLIALMKHAAEGGCRLSDRRDIRRQDEVESTVLQFFGDGASSLSLHDLAVIMIRLSDNISTNIFIDLLGYERINGMLDDLGLGSMRLRRKMGQPRKLHEKDENTATPRDAVKLLEMLHDGRRLGAALCRDVLDILKLPKHVPSPMRDALPLGTVIASKSGTLDAVRNEWAIVYAPGRPFAIAAAGNYLGEDASPTIGRITRLAYDYFGRLGQSTAYGARADEAGGGLS